MARQLLAYNTDELLRPSERTGRKKTLTSPRVREHKASYHVARVSRVADLSELMTIQEVATHLKVHRDTVYGWIYENKLAVRRIGRSLRVSVTALEEFLGSSA